MPSSASRAGRAGTRLRRAVSLLVVAVALAIASGGACAAAAADAAAFIDDLVHKGLQTLADKQLPPQAREQRFDELLAQDFDVPRIARFVLGRYWNSASDQERQQFTRVFEQWVIRTYSARFSEYDANNVQVKVTGQRPESANAFVVSSQIQRPSGAPPAKVDWRVVRSGDSYKIVDVDVEGVSMALTQREEFASVIQRNGGTVTGLTKALEQKIARGDTSGAAGLPQTR